jgi:hypothetical protein
LLIDTSPSTEYRLKQIKAFAIELTQHLDLNDRVLVGSFNSDVKMGKETDDRKLAESQIRKLKMGDGTSLYNAIGESAAKISLNGGVSALVIISDGVDTTSRKMSYERSLEAFEQTPAKVFVMYLDTFFDNDVQTAVAGQMFSRPPGGVGIAKEDYLRGGFYLTDLMQLSGGHTIRYSEQISAQQSAIDSLVKELHSQYFLTMRLAGPAGSNVRHIIKIRINRPHLTVLAKGRYVEE